MPGNYFIAKLYRQHHSVVMAVPQPVRVALGLKTGDHVVLQWRNPDGFFVLSKFVPVGAKDDSDREHTDSEDTSRGTSTEIGG